VLSARVVRARSRPLNDEWRLTAIRHRLADPNVLPTERARMQKLVPAKQPAEASA
jgi:hypothetical protein